MVRTKKQLQAQNPLLLRCHRLMEAFAKSDDERDFYLDNMEGFIVYVDLDKSQDELHTLAKEIESQPNRYLLIPKLTFYETKKIMEGFVHEKVYDIDTKEKLLEIIQSKEARENFLEFIYDHHSELEKWQQYYQERSRVRIIEWLRKHEFTFVFEEDIDFSRKLMEKIKESLFNPKVNKDIAAARKLLESKAKTYYSNEALNPRPKRGRPPKQIIKTEAEPQVSVDLYTSVSSSVRPFLFIPDTTGPAAVTFSTKFESEEKLLAIKRGGPSEAQSVLESLNQKLADLRNLSSKWLEGEKPKKPEFKEPTDEELFEFVDEVEDLEEVEAKPKKTPPQKKEKPKEQKSKPSQKIAPPKKKIEMKKIETKKVDTKKVQAKKKDKGKKR